MLIRCNNKGCYDHTNAKLDVKTDEVICSTCGKPIENISSSMKRILLQNGQIIRPKKTSFQVKCPVCNDSVSVKITKGDVAKCSICDTELNVSKAMILVLKAKEEEEKDL